MTCFNIECRGDTSSYDLIDDGEAENTQPKGQRRQPRENTPVECLLWICLICLIAGAFCWGVYTGLNH